MTIPMAHAFMADTWGTCMIANTGEVVFVKLIKLPPLQSIGVYAQRVKVLRHATATEKIML